MEADVHLFRLLPSGRFGGSRPNLAEHSGAGVPYLSESLFFVKLERTFLMESPMSYLRILKHKNEILRLEKNFFWDHNS
jgi:hypothetical protein